MMKCHNSYTEKEIKNSIGRLNIKNGDNLYISANLANFGYPKLKNINDLPKIFYKYIKKAIGKNGTIIVPTHSFKETKNLCKPWSVKFKSESGIFSNLIMRNKKAIRQFHPFASVCALGKKAKYICSRKSSSAYSKMSPFHQMIKLNTKFISLGIKFNYNCSQVHFLEYQNKVPYRYKKLFIKKIKYKKKNKYQKFYLYVLKNKYINFKRNRNKLIFKNFQKFQKIKKIRLADSYIYLYDLKKFYEVTNKLMKKNKLCWLGK